MNADKISAVKTASICMAATTVHVMKATCLEKDGKSCEGNNFTKSPH